jgi:hypothetical protein
MEDSIGDAILQATRAKVRQRMTQVFFLKVVDEMGFEPTPSSLQTK